MTWLRRSRGRSGLTCLAELLQQAREGTEPDVDGRRPARAWARESGRLREVRLRAVLERTCVVASPGKQHVRWLVRHSDVFVDAGAMAWRPVSDRLVTPWPGTWLTSPDRSRPGG